VSATRSALLNRYLDPTSRLSELLFGLIMTLTFTLGARLTIREDGAEGARGMLIATIGCCLAWGIIDGVLYIVGAVHDRGRRKRVGLAVQRETDDARARDLIAEEFDEVIGSVTSAPERARLYQSVVQRIRASTIPPNRLTGADLGGAFASFWLVLFACLPAAVPFVLIDDPTFALRVSNAILLALLFWAGYSWGRKALIRPWLAGSLFLLGGAALVVIAIALGG